MKYRRSFNTLTVLPDGKVLATGGQTKTDGVDETTGVLPAEMWDPDTEHVDDDGVAATGRGCTTRPRSCCRTAASCWPAAAPTARRQNENSGEIYSPPYLFKGPRPTDHRRPERAALRPVVHGRHAGRGPHLEGHARAHGLGHAQLRHGPALHGAQRPRRATASSTVSAPAERQRGAARLVHGLPGRRQRRAVERARSSRSTLPGDTQSPTAPAALTAHRRDRRSANLSWTPSTDNVGVDRVPRVPVARPRASRRAPPTAIATVTTRHGVRRPRRRRPAPTTTACGRSTRPAI